MNISFQSVFRSLNPFDGAIFESWYEQDGKQLSMPAAAGAAAEAIGEIPGQAAKGLLSGALGSVAVPLALGVGIYLFMRSR